LDIGEISSVDYPIYRRESINYLFRERCSSLFIWVSASTAIRMASLLEVKDYKMLLTDGFGM
jgi:hypothetical protein